MKNKKIRHILDKAISIIGQQRNENLETPLYEFLRRYGPMPCTDIVLVPKDKKPSVILARRGNNAVAPDSWFIFGGRVDKKMNYEETASSKVKTEIGIEIRLEAEDIIGFGRTYFKPDNNEIPIRNYDIGTSALVFAKQISLNKKTIGKIKPSDGHNEWSIFRDIESNWHPYVISTVASAWKRFYGSEALVSLDKKSRAIIKDSYHFIPLRFEPNF